MRRPGFVVWEILHWHPQTIELHLQGREVHVVNHLIKVRRPGRPHALQKLVNKFHIFLVKVPPQVDELAEPHHEVLLHKESRLFGPNCGVGENVAGLRGRHAQLHRTHEGETVFELAAGEVGVLLNLVAHADGAENGVGRDVGGFGAAADGLSEVVLFDRGDGGRAFRGLDAVQLRFHAVEGVDVGPLKGLGLFTGEPHGEEREAVAGEAVDRHLAVNVAYTPDFKGFPKIGETVFRKCRDDVFEVADDVIVPFSEESGDIGGKGGGDAVVKCDDGKKIGHCSFLSDF